MSSAGNKIQPLSTPRKGAWQDESGRCTPIDPGAADHPFTAAATGEWGTLPANVQSAVARGFPPTADLDLLAPARSVRRERGDRNRRA